MPSVFLSLVIFPKQSSDFLNSQHWNVTYLLFFSSGRSGCCSACPPLLRSAELFRGGTSFFGCWLLFWCWYVVFLPLLLLPVWFLAGLYDTVLLGVVSRALLVLLIWAILLFSQSPKSSSDTFGTFFDNCLIQPGNLGLIMSLRNWLVSLAACPKTATTSINGVRSSLRSILYLPNLLITFSQVSVSAYAAEIFNNWILRRLLSVTRFAVTRFSFQTWLFTLGALK